MQPTPPRDAGFSLVETLTSIAIMGVVMTALTTFFVSTTTTLNKERGLQMAVRLAQDGIELVKSLPGSAIISGRSAADVTEQFNTDVIPGFDVKGLLGSMLPAADTSLSSTASSLNPLLPVVPEVLKVNDTSFQRHWFVGSCQMPLGGTVCNLVTLPGTLLTFYRVVVAVTWHNDRACPKTAGVCSYVTQTLTTASPTDPVFNPSVTVVPPLPDNPGNQTGEATAAIVPFTLTATTAYPPLAWSAENLPPGVTINDAGLISGTPTTAGTYVVRVIVKDQAATNDASFNWDVAAAPAVAPVDQTWDAGTAVSYTVPLTGGTGPFTWTATGLPAGLSISATTGVITGTSTATGAAAKAAVTVKAVDKYGKIATAAFKWNTKVAVQYPSGATPIALTKGVAYTGSALAYGGTGTYTWTATNMPPGLSLSGAGVLTGTVTGSTRYLVTLTVTDSGGGTDTELVPVDITVPVAGQLRITAPTSAAPDKAGTKGTVITPQTVAATGGTTPYTWTATSLPPGVTINAATGTMTGTPNIAGSYTVSLTVTDKLGASSLFMFVWKIS